MLHPWHIAVLSAFVCSFVSPLASAYPISPAPLWELVERSQTIVLADVAEVREVKTDKADETPWNSAVAHLRVRETWKGEVLEELEVAFPANLLCPAPPRYIAGNVVIAFLARGKDSAWDTVALSYGTLYPRREEVEEYRLRVREAVALQRRHRPTEADILEWVTRTAARRSTRWHGLYELAGGTDRLHSYYDRSGAHRSLASRLSLAQLRSIADGFVAEPSVDRTLPMALTVLSVFKSRDVDLAAASAIEALLAQKDVPWWLPDALRLTMARFGDSAADARVARLGKDFEDVDPEEARRVWQEARLALKIVGTDGDHQVRPASGRWRRVRPRPISTGFFSGLRGPSSGS